MLVRDDRWCAVTSGYEMNEPYEQTPLTTPTRLRHRVSYDRDAVHAVLDEAVVCHLGFVMNGRPVVLPQLYVRVEHQLYLHGSSGAGAFGTAERAAMPVCVTVTLLDGVVLARSAFHHSINYRSVVAHGALVVDPVEKESALTALVEAVVPGRAAGIRGPNRRELAATSVLRLPLAEVSLKVRNGPPVDDPDDLELPWWAGVLPVSSVAGAAAPAPDLLPGVGVPDHVTSWRARGATLQPPL